MAIVLAQYPGDIWDGLSENVWRRTRLDDLGPDPHDWNQIVAEMLSTQIVAAGHTNIFASGNANQLLGTNDDANGTEWKTIVVNVDYLTLTHNGANIEIGMVDQWDDIRILPTLFDFAGANDPSAVAWQPGGSGITLRGWEFQLDDVAYFSFQMPHGYKLGTNLHPHVHWTNRNRGPNEVNSVVAWEIDYTVAEVGGVFASTSNVKCYGTANSSVNDTHFYADHNTANDVVNMSSVNTVSAMCICRVRRADVAEDTWVGTASGDLPILLEVDFHYQLDTIGSATEGEK